MQLLCSSLSQQKFAFAQQRFTTDEPGKIYFCLKILNLFDTHHKITVKHTTAITLIPRLTKNSLQSRSKSRTESTVFRDLLIQDGKRFGGTAQSLQRYTRKVSHSKSNTGIDNHVFCVYEEYTKIVVYRESSKTTAPKSSLCRKTRPIAWLIARIASIWYHSSAEIDWKHQC